jgi:hypothetical protein
LNTPNYKNDKKRKRFKRRGFAPLKHPWKLDSFLSQKAFRGWVDWGIEPEDNKGGWGDRVLNEL